MRKIMLVIDDYKELVALENLLRRLGFDVLSIGKDVLLNDALARFHPEIVIATAKGRAVDGLKVAARLKKQLAPPRIALAYPSTTPLSLSPDSQKLVDGMISMPIQPASAIKLIAQLGNFDATALQEKLQKFSSGRGSAGAVTTKLSGDGGATETVRVSGGAKTESEPWDPKSRPGSAATFRSSRSDRYESFLGTQEAPPAHQPLTREKAQAINRELKPLAEKDKSLVDEVNLEKLRFARAMFVDVKSKKP